MLKILFIASLILFTGNAFAAVPGVELSSTDETLFYMSVIFGDSVMFLSGHSLQPENEFDTVLGQLSWVFNNSMVLLNAILITFVMSTAFFDTAHKGKLNTQKYDSVWLPVRIIFSMLIMQPYSGGYNALQLGVFYVAGAGIQTANNLTTASLDYMRKTGTPINLRYQHDIEHLAMNLLESWVCKFTLDQMYMEDGNVEAVIVEKDLSHIKEIKESTDVNGNATYTEVMSAIVDGFSFKNNANAVEWENRDLWDIVTKDHPLHSLPENVCGAYSIGQYDSPSEVSDDIALVEYINTHNNMVTELDSQMSELAFLITHQQSFGNNVSSSIPVNPNALRESLIQARGTSQIALEDLVNNVITGFATSSSGGSFIDERIEEVKEAGWIRLATMYWDWSTVNQRLLEIQQSIFVKQSVPPTSKIFEETETQTPLKNLTSYLNEDRYISIGSTEYKEAKELPPRYSGIGINTTSLSEDDIIKQKMQTVQTDNKEYMQDFVHGLLTKLSTPSGDTLTTVVGAGRYMLNAAETLFWSKIAVESMVDWTKAKAESNAKSDSINPIKNLIESGWGYILYFGANTLKALASAMTLIIIASASLGVLAALYIPMIPIIQWVIGVMNYFIIMIELVIVAPIHALSHSFPEGQGISGERAKTGYMLIVGLFLGPPLMVFGFYAAIIMVNIGGLILFSLIGSYIESFSVVRAGATEFPLVSFVVMPFGITGIVLMTMITIVQRSFSLINELRDKALRMLGGGAETYGDATSMNEIANKVTMAGGVMGAGLGNIEAGTKHDRGNPDKEKKNPNKGSDNESSRDSDAEIANKEPAPK